MASLQASICWLIGSAYKTGRCALTFASLVLTSLGLVLVNRSFESSMGEALRRYNPALWWISAFAISLLGLALAWEPARDLFCFGKLHGDDVAVTLIAAVALVVVVEVSKRFWRRHLIA